MNGFRWMWFLGLLACCGSGLAQGILIPASWNAVQGAPFTLTVETHWDRISGEGPRQGIQRILRDSAGRQRYEAPMLDGAPRSSTVGIYDVVAGKYIKLDMDAKTAEVAPMSLGRAVVLDVSTATSLPPSIAEDGQTLLGTREIAGLEAWGQRTVKTTTRRDGTAVVQDRELWTSTHYRMGVMQILRSDKGKMTQTVASFSSAEPDPTLFRIPADFAVSDAPPPPPPAPGTVRIGGKVSAPVVLKAGQAEFSEWARQAKVNGDVLVHLIVDEQGMPRDVKVVRGIGMGLDEKAVYAVKQYRFKPAMRDGAPVKVEMQIDIVFQVFGTP